MTDWKTIESAPKDGTDIIVYRPNFDGTYIPQVGTDYWSSRLNCWAKSRCDTPPIAWQPMPTPPRSRAVVSSPGKDTTDGS